MITITLNAAIDDVGTLQKFHISDQPFVSLPSDGSPNVAFDNTILDLSFGTFVFQNGKTTGSSGSFKGELNLININGMYDKWVDYSFEGRKITIRKGVPGAAFPSGFTTLFTGIVDTINVAYNNVSISIKDKLYLFDKPVLSKFYAGTNVLPDGLEGTTNDIGGEAKPKVYGSVFNITPVLVNTSKLTYQVNDGPVTSIIVKDKGVILTNRGDYANSAALQAATLMLSDGYVTCLAEGYFRLINAPAGKITSDVIQNANATVASIMNTLALSAGFLSSEISTNILNVFALNQPALVGIYITGETSFVEAFDELASSVGAFYAFDPTGILNAGVLSIPDEFFDFSLEEYNVIGDLDRSSPRDNPIPVYQIKYNYKPNYTVLSPTDIAGIVGTSTVSILGSRHTTIQSANEVVLNKYTNAKTVEFDSLIVNAADANAELTRVLNLYSIRRDIFNVTIGFDSLPDSPFFLMASIRLIHHRFNLNLGKNFKLIGISFDIIGRTANLTLWG